MRRLFLMVAVVAVVSLGVSCVLQIQQDARRIESSHEFRMIALALVNHSSGHSSLPQPVYYDPSNSEVELYSWRYRIIPNIASYKLNVSFEHPWEHPANSMWLRVPQPYAFGGWGNGMGDTRNYSDIPTETSVYAITGPDTAFGDGELHAPSSVDDLPHDIILAAEIRGSGHHWMQNGDFDIRTITKSIGSSDGNSISGNHKDGFFIMFADTKIWFLSNDTPFEKLSLFLTIEGATANDREKILSEYRQL